MTTNAAPAPAAPEAAAPDTSTAPAGGSEPKVDDDIDRALSRRTREKHVERQAQKREEPKPEPKAEAKPEPKAEPSAEEKAAEAKAAEARRLRKIKVEGEEQDYDLDNEEQVLKDVQMGRVATKRMQEAAKIKRVAEQLVSGLRGDDPIGFLQQVAPKLGLDPTKLRAASEKLLAKELEQELLTPEERQARAEKEELETFRRKEADAKKRKDAEAFEKLKLDAEQNYSKKFQDALELGGIPRTPFTLQRMAQLQLLANKHKIDITPAELAQRVREDYIAEQKALFGSVDSDTLLKLLDEGVVSKVREADLKRHRERNTDGTFAPAQRREGTPAPAADEKGQKKVMDRAAFMRELKRGA